MISTITIVTLTHVWVDTVVERPRRCFLTFCARLINSLWLIKKALLESLCFSISWYSVVYYHRKDGVIIDMDNKPVFERKVVCKIFMCTIKNQYIETFEFWVFSNNTETFEIGHNMQIAHDKYEHCFCCSTRKICKTLEQLI